MKISARIKAATNVLLSRNSLSDGQVLSRRFLKHGNARPLVQDWSQIIMTEQDTYTGYMYAAINKRANRVAGLAARNLLTDADKKITDVAKKNEEQVTHPYIETIDSSTTFSNNKFWKDISTYLDLEGVYYLMVVRNYAQADTGAVRYGRPQEFKLLNPFEVKRIINKETLEIGGYVEYRGGLVREIPKEMIIEMRELNPFSEEDPYSLADAAKDSQFTMKQAGDYTRHSLKNNMAAPGIISTDMALEPEEFMNFRSRIVNQEKGEPLFGNGSGAVTWDAMQIEMDKAGLDKINEIQLNGIIAGTGVSKTMLGIEQSGVTRDTAKVQKDLFVEDSAMPRLQLIIDALNQDYKTNYSADYEQNKYNLYIDNPLATDRDAELKDTDIKTKNFDLYMSLVNKGYDTTIAAKYVEGKMELDELGEPSNDPVSPIPDTTEEEKTADNALHTHDHIHDVEIVVNELEETDLGIITTQQGALQNAVVNIEQRLVGTVIDRVTTAKNAYDSQSDLISNKEKQAFQNELEIALAAFYGIVIPLYATSVLAKRAKETQLFGTFALNAEVKAYIKKTAGNASTSHINTIVDDLFEAVRQAAGQGQSVEQIVATLRKEYSDTISKVRAKTIARTETNRAFSTAQYEADKQFIKQNKLGGRVYKQWITRSATPCQYCLNMAAQPPIPFSNNFLDLGDELSYTFTKLDGKQTLRKMVVGFEPVTNGTLHPNCACTYRLIIDNSGV